jgi:serine/threonine protein kinase
MSRTGAPRAPCEGALAPQAGVARSRTPRRRSRVSPAFATIPAEARAGIWGAAISSVRVSPLALTVAAAEEVSCLNGGDVLADKYLLVEPIGSGGMGQVWLARNLATGAEVAAKVLLSSRLRSEAGIARFRREAQATAKLSHRAIVRVFDLIELDPARGSLVMVLELLRGRTLAQRLEHQGALSLDETLSVALPILSALTHAHGLGIVHRDLKPDNILLAQDPDGHLMPKILDFGISKMLRDGDRPITGANEILGTLSYMSPEQARGQAVDARSDVFSVGILLYECLTGRNPFVGDAPVNIDSMLAALLRSDVQPSALIPEEIWPVIQRALATRAEDRFATAGALASALTIAAPSAAAFEAMPAPARSRTMSAATVSSHPRPIGRRRGVAATAIVAAAGIVIFSAVAQSARLHAVARAHVERAPVTKHVEQTVDQLALADRTDASPSAAASASFRAKRLRDAKVAIDPGF